MKKICFLLAILLFNSCSVLAKDKFDIKFPLKGESCASPRLQYDTMMGVIATATMFNTKCNSYSIADTKLIFGLQDGVMKDNKYVEGYWKEAWIVNRCKQQLLVPILFTLDGKGGTYYQIINSEVKVIE